MHEDTRFQTGLARLNSLDADGAAKVLESLQSVAPDFGRLMIEFGYGDIHVRPGLDIASRQIATLAALAALPDARPQLAFHVGASLAAGCSPAEIVEVMILTGVFAGFPATLNGISTVKEVFAARGVAFTPPAAATVYPTGLGRRERGLKAIEATSKGAGQAVLDSLAAVAPDLAGFLIDFSYGDVIARQVLSAKHKEIVMIAAATARGGMRPQLKVHLRAGLNVGLTREEIAETLMQMAGYAGFPAALNALSALREVLEDGR
jgi:4-carboxymuconolactone decarboxylase